MLPSNTCPLARLVLLSLLLTFAVARLFSILMTLHRMPDIYLHVRDTHIHHLNYGIFLLAGVGAYLLFSPGPPAALPAHRLERWEEHFDADAYLLPPLLLSTPESDGRVVASPIELLVGIVTGT